MNKVSMKSIVDVLAPPWSGQMGYSLWMAQFGHGANVHDFLLGISGSPGIELSADCGRRWMEATGFPPTEQWKEKENKMTSGKTDKVQRKKASCIASLLLIFIISIPYHFISYLFCKLFMTVYLFTAFMCCNCMMSVYFTFNLLVQTWSFWVPGRPLEALPPTEIQFSLWFSLVLSNDSCHDHSGGEGDLHCWPSHKSSDPGAAGHPPSLLPCIALGYLILLSLGDG